MTDHVPNETLRKTLHIAFGLFAFTLRWLPWWAAAGVAAAAIVGNWLVLHRVFGREVARESRGFDFGIIAYPTVVLLLIVIFRDRLHIAAIAWGMLAFGDGVATLAGKALPAGRLPWNEQKSWGGMLGFIAAGAASGIALGYWLGYERPVVIALAAACAAIVESLSINVDDNLTVPAATATFLVVAGFEPASAYGVWPQTPAWLAVNGGLAIAGYYSRSVTASGALGGWALGSILILGAGWPLYVALLVFFVIATAATRAGYARKASAGLAQEGGGRRGFTHAFANTGAAAICAIAMSRIARAEGHSSGAEMLPLFMGIAALATAAADTTASEIGQLLGKRPFLPLTMKRVAPGTEGAVSIEGTVAGILAGAIVSLAGALAAHQAYDVVFHAPLVVALTTCAFLGSWVESVAGSWNRRLVHPVTNGALNFFNTVIGAALFYLAARLLPLVVWRPVIDRLPN